VKVQGFASFEHHKLTRHMGELSSTQMTHVKTALRDLLGL
jgi:mRNA-degrading endonuclease toxin of MazEF toxin-antitoxin module